MPKGHPFAARRVIVPADFADVPFVSFRPETDIGHQITALLDAHGIDPIVALATNIAPTVCAFVASGPACPLCIP
ncbi:MAG: LysR substrate-binding domain-containing protein [Janthinobacterium lividum]